MVEFCFKASRAGLKTIPEQPEHPLKSRFHRRARKQFMNLEKTFESIFGNLNPLGFSVIRTTPAGKDWFVAVDQKTMRPIWEGDERSEVEQVAEWNMQVRDLAFIADHANNDRPDVDRLYSGFDLTKSQDGLNLILPKMVLGTSTIDVSDKFTAAAAELNKDWSNWLVFRHAARVLASTPANECVVIEFEVNVPDAGLDDPKTQSVTVKLDFDRINQINTSKGGVTISRLDTRLNENGYKLKSVFDRYAQHTMQSTPVESSHDFQVLVDHFKTYMPLYAAHAQGDVSKQEKVIVLEGGKVLEELALKRPWMVEKDQGGKALPLRISTVLTPEDATEDAVEKEACFISSVVVRDKLTELVRQKVIETQRAAGFVSEQVMPEGRQFKQVADLLGSKLEVMYDRTTPNTLGTRDWLSYRLWVEGELVLDVHPSNELQYAARTASLSPMMPIDWADPQPSAEQVAEILDMALTDVGASGDEDSPDYRLPPRVQDFLGSSFADDLRLAANDLREGNATLENGVFTEVEQDEDGVEHAL